MRQDVQTFIIQAACKLPPRSPDLVDVIVAQIFLSAMGYMNEPYWAVKEHCELITSGEVESKTRWDDCSPVADVIMRLAYGRELLLRKSFSSFALHSYVNVF